jgi:hypothetical protein
LISHTSAAFLILSLLTSSSFPLLSISFPPFFSLSLQRFHSSLPLHCRLNLFRYFFYFLLLHTFLTFVFFFSTPSCPSSSQQYSCFFLFFRFKIFLFVFILLYLISYFYLFSFSLSYHPISFFVAPATAFFAFSFGLPPFHFPAFYPFSCIYFYIYSINNFPFRCLCLITHLFLVATLTLSLCYYSFSILFAYQFFLAFPAFSLYS